MFNKLENKEIPDISSQQNDLQNQIDDLQMQISILESQLYQNQNELYEREMELVNVENGILYRYSKRIAVAIDKVFPPNSNGGEIISLLQISIVTLQNEGLVTLLRGFSMKLKRQFMINQKKNFSDIDLTFLNVNEIDNNQENQNVLYSHKKIKPEKELRKFLQLDSTNILDLPEYPKVSIIILTLDKVALLRRNISSIESKSTYKNFEIIIITNNLNENSEMRNFLKESKYQYYLYHDEYSFSGMNNFGAKKANGEFLLFLNDDVEILSPYWLESMLKLALNDS